MKGLGHFPMSEDPEKFVSYLLAGAGEDQGALSRKPPERLERVRSNVSTSMPPATSIVTTIWSLPIAVESTLAPAGNAAVTSAKAPVTARFPRGEKRDSR